MATTSSRAEKPRRRVHQAIALTVVASLTVAVATVWPCMSGSAGAVATAAGEPAGPWSWPLTPVTAVVGAFDPPDSRYGAGNRGVDLAGSIGQTVRSIGAGVVTFAAVLAGRGVVVVQHARFRSTYEPVSAGVAVGDRVVGGEPIGILSSVGSHCPPQACLHLGVIRGSTYLDPLSLFADSPVRLKPLAGLSGSSAPVAFIDAATLSASTYSWPVIR